MISAAEEAEEEAAEEDDLTITGTIESTEDGSLVLKTEDGSYTLNTLIAQTVTKDGVKAEQRQILHIMEIWKMRKFPQSPQKL